MSTSRPSAVLHDLLNCLVFLLEVADCVLLPAFYIDRATLQIGSIHVMLAMSSIFKADCCILGFLDSTWNVAFISWIQRSMRYKFRIISASFQESLTSCLRISRQPLSSAIVLPRTFLPHIFYAQPITAACLGFVLVLHFSWKIRIYSISEKYWPRWYRTHSDLKMLRYYRLNVCLLVNLSVDR